MRAVKLFFLVLDRQMRRSRIPAIAHALVCVTARMAPSYYSDYEATPSFGVKSSEKLKQAEPTTIACVSHMQIYKDTSYESCFESFCDPTRVGGSGVYLHCRACMSLLRPTAVGRTMQQVRVQGMRVL